MHIIIGRAGDKSYRIDPFAGELHQNRLPEAPVPIHDHVVHDFLDRKVNTANHWYFIQQSFTVADNLCTNNALGDEAADEDQDNRENNAQAGDVETDQRIRMVLPGYNREQPIHHIDEKYEDIESQADWDDNRKSGQKNILEI